MAKAPLAPGDAWQIVNGTWTRVPTTPAAAPVNQKARYTGVPTGGYAPLQDVLTNATGFTKGKGTEPNTPTGGGALMAKDYSQANRIAARPDLIRSKLPPQLARGRAPARVQQMTNRAPTSNPTANALRAIEGNSNG